MPELHDILAYITQRHEATSTQPLTNARLTKIVYLADWGASLKLGRQLSGIEWTFNHHGPWVPDVILAVEDRPESFVLDAGRRADGNTFRLVRPAADAQLPQLDGDVREILDRAIGMSADKPFGEFVDMVYETYPVKASNRYDTLNLRELAAAYKRHSVEQSSGDASNVIPLRHAASR